MKQLQWPLLFFRGGALLWGDSPQIADICPMKYAIFFSLLLFTCLACEPKSSGEAPTVSKTPVVAPTSAPAQTSTSTSAPAETTPASESSPSPTTSPEAPVSLSGDFNGDGAPDFLEIRMTSREDRDLGKERDLVVYSGADKTRKDWYTAKGVLLPTEGGGVMGDPLEDVSILGNTIVIKHFGGSRQKWNYTHRFRWQNGDFQLIGVTVHTGAPCEYFVDLDYNLSTGNAEWAKATEDCSQSEDDPAVSEMIYSFVEKPKVPTSMNGFLTGEHELKIPNMNESVYF
jgi:hypothetical protein